MTDGLESEVLEMCTYTSHVIEKGRIETEEARVRTMLDLGRAPKEIAEFCGYDLAFVESVASKLKTE